LSDPSNPQPRHAWMPNRMFDPATNPFAIQNLLKKEKKEDTPFLLKWDERPVFNYSDDALLKESKTQPAVDFQFNELLDQPLPSAPAFQVEPNETASPDIILADSSEKFPEIPSASSELILEIPEQNFENVELDEELAARLQVEASIFTSQAVDSDEISHEMLADDLACELVADKELSQSDHLSLADHVREIDPSPESVSDQIIEVQSDSSNDEPQDQAHHADEPNELSADVDLQSDEIVVAPSDTHSEPEAVGQSVMNASAGFDNQAVTQLKEAAREEARVEAHAAGFQEGIQAGIGQAKTEMQTQLDEKLAVFDQIIQGLQQLERDPNALFEPMKKLAMHLAEQLVRGELTQSAQVIARLVDNCLRELAASGEKAVIVHLNPEDLEQYKPLIAQFGDSLVLRPDALLARGSVRASLDGSVVEDLIDRRVKGLSKSLAQPVASSWRPALATPSAKPTVASKPATTAAPVATATPAATLDAHDNENDEVDDSDHDDDVMFDDLSDDHIDNPQADRNDETHS